MDILFLLTAVCPALLVTGYEMKGRRMRWQVWVSRAAGWFYVITFANMLLLYLNGWGSYDFTSVSVQFLTGYMFRSAVIIGIAELCRWAYAHAGKGGPDV